ncbi:MAG: DUF433 domain-containing protein [Dehalococcoidia bacterium]
MPTLHEVNITIRETPNVCGGYPCIGNTRIPARALVEVLGIDGSIEAVGEYFPQLSRAEVDAALAYYMEHPSRVDEDIARNHVAWEELAPARHQPGGDGGSWYRRLQGRTGRPHSRHCIA